MKLSVIIMAMEKYSERRRNDVDNFQTHTPLTWLEGYECMATINCELCKASTTEDCVMMVPTTVTALDFYRSTPEMLAKYEGCLHFSRADRTEVLCWPITLMEAAVMMLYHTFHAAKVHCGVLQNVLGSEVVSLKRGIHFVLVVALRDHHYALIELDLKRFEVTIWDSASHMDEFTSLWLWRDMVVTTLKVYCPEDVSGNGDNVDFVTTNGEIVDIPAGDTMNNNDVDIASAKESYNLKAINNLSRWTVTTKGSYKQENNYACGPISLNRLASRLKEITMMPISNPAHALVRLPEALGEQNSANAVSMVQHLLLLTRHGPLFKWEDGVCFERAPDVDDDENADKDEENEDNKHRPVFAKTMKEMHSKGGQNNWCANGDKDDDQRDGVADPTRCEIALTSSQSSQSFFEDGDSTSSSISSRSSHRNRRDDDHNHATVAATRVDPTRCEIALTSSQSSQSFFEDCDSTSSSISSRRSHRNQCDDNHNHANVAATRVEATRCEIVCTTSQSSESFFEESSRMSAPIDDIKDQPIEDVTSMVDDYQITNVGKVDTSSSLKRRTEIDPGHMNETPKDKRYRASSVVTRSKSMSGLKAARKKGLRERQERLKKKVLYFDVVDNGYVRSPGLDERPISQIEVAVENHNGPDNSDVENDNDRDYSYVSEIESDDGDEEITDFQGYNIQHAYDRMYHPEIDTPFDEELDQENHFPAPIDLSGHDGGLLSLLRCTVDADSLYLTAKKASHILEFIGSDGTAEFQSSVCRDVNCKSSRFSINYGNNEDLRPRMIGKKLTNRSRVVSLENFHNVNLLTVNKVNASFTVSLFLIQPRVLGDNNRMNHSMLLTLIAALNCAMEANLPARRCPGKENLPVGTMNRFELQSMSKEKQKHIKSIRKPMTSEQAKLFLERFECCLRIMATDPEAMEPRRQAEDTPDKYWSERQMVSLGGGGVLVSVDEMKANAGILVHRVLFVATAAGVKDVYQFDDKNVIWDGSEESLNCNNDRGRLQDSFSRFKEKQFVNIKRSFLMAFPGLSESHRMYDKVKFFADIGINCRPCEEHHYFAVELSTAKQMLRESLRGSTADDESLVSENSDAFDSQNDEGEEASFGLKEDIVAEQAEQEETDVEFWDVILERVKVYFMSYPKHCNQKLGNIHTGKIRMNPVSVPSTSTEVQHWIAQSSWLMVPMEDCIEIVHSGEYHLVGGQIYEQYLRLEEMAQTRPDRASIFPLLPHITNLCCNGGHLHGATVKDSMKVAETSFSKVTELYDHRLSKRKSQPSNSVRVELFLAFNMKDGSGRMVTISHLPNIDVSRCIKCFFSEDLNEFERQFVENHLHPLRKIFKNVRTLLEKNELTNFQETYSAAARTRMLASAEILTHIADDSLGGRGYIQKNMYTTLNEGTVSMDIPRRVRVPLSERERKFSGFAYGVLPEMCPQFRGLHTVVPKHLSLVRPDDLSNHFPLYYPPLDRLCSRKLCKDRGFDVGMLERGKAMIRQYMHNVCEDVLSLEADNVIVDGNHVRRIVGVMDVPDYGALIRCDASVRLDLFRNVARLLILRVCQCTHEDLVEAKVFGLRHGLTSPGFFDDNDDLSLAFKDFPFTLEKVGQYLRRDVGETKFQKRPHEVSSTGTLSVG